MAGTRVRVQRLVLVCLSFLLIVAGARGAQITERLGREENRTTEIGEQTQQVAQELDTIVRDLEVNQLLTRDENKDFGAARQGMDEIGRREIRAVLERLAAARQALDRAKQQEQLRSTIGAQEKLIARLTEELVRIQYRSQMRHLLEQMRTIVTDQRQAIRTTQNSAIELVATNSEALRSDILDRVTQTQDGINNDWTLVREEVNVILGHYGDLPFIDTLRQFQGKAKSLPLEQQLAETRDHVKGQRFGLAVTGQRKLADQFLELLKILQSGGLSPAEQRSAMENLIEKTEEALRQQQDLRAQTETLGRDLTEPLRNEMARAEDQLGNFVRDLAQEADQAARPETGAPQTTPAESRSEAQSPQSAIRNPQSAIENPWAEAKTPPAATPAQTPPPTSPAANDLSKAADNMSDAANRLNQAKPREASAAQQEAINRLASALANMREQLDNAQRSAELDALADMLNQQNELLDQLGEIIRNQQNLMAQTQQAAPAKTPSAQSSNQDQTAAENAKPGEKSATAQTPGQEQNEQSQSTNPQSESQNPKSPLELGEAQKQLGGKTQEFSNQVAGAAAVNQSLAKAVNEMDSAASQLGQSQTAQALPHQNEALRSLREAERQLAEAMAEALNAEQPKEWLEQIGNLDQLIGQIEQMAGEAEVLPPAPAPAMAQQAEGVALELGAMGAAAPMGPAMAAQLQQGSQLMRGASQQLNEGQPQPAAQTMHQAASALGSVRDEMAGQMASELAQAQAQAQAAAKAQAAQLGQQIAQSAASQSMAARSSQPAQKPAQTGKGQGMRGTGSTKYDPKQLEKILESGDWSRLPEREREEVLQALKEKYPARYERDLIRYYRNLSRVEAKP